jgi:hypothetical protein
MLGKDPPARMEPMVIQFAEEKFPRNIQPRKYGPEQKIFLREQIPIMLKAKILQLSHSRFGCCPFIPYKSDGSLRFCLDQRPANKVIESTKFPIPDMHEMVQSVNGQSFSHASTRHKDISNARCRRAATSTQQSLQWKAYTNLCA